MTESEIAYALWNKWGRAETVAKNIKMYPFESDVLMLRKSGLLSEYEIKLSVSDFNADGKKSYGYKNTSKYDWLQSGRGPNRFYYVLPEEMEPKVQLPRWAGLITVSGCNYTDGLVLTIRKQAGLLHKNKAGLAVKEKILTCMYYKYWNNLVK